MDVDYKKLGKDVLDKGVQLADKAARIGGRTIQRGAQGLGEGVKETIMEGKTFGDFFNSITDPHLDSLAKKLNDVMGTFYDGKKINQKYPSPNFKKTKSTERIAYCQMYDLGSAICANTEVDITRKTALVEKILSKDVESVGDLEVAIRKDVTEAMTSEEFSKELVQYHLGLLEIVKKSTAKIPARKKATIDEAVNSRNGFLQAYKTELKQTEGIAKYIKSPAVKGTILFAGANILLGPLGALTLAGLYVKDELSREGNTPKVLFERAKERSRTTLEYIRDHRGEIKDSLVEKGRDVSEKVKGYWNRLFQN
ncbi:hypothetical protein HY837_02815 [archaeon]|nr:hypothetical protein [archaeon]